MPERSKTAKATKPKTTRKKPVARKKPAAPKVAKPEVVKEAPAPKAPVHRTYLFAVGRRKTAIARVRLYQRGTGVVTVNQKPLESYFTLPTWQTIVLQPLTVSGYSRGDFSVKVAGGGVQSQAESVRHGIARALLLADPSLRKTLKPAGLLTRDARVKERKKYGLKRARRAPQWQKR